jgi:hypothetical protein
MPAGCEDRMQTSDAHRAKALELLIRADKAPDPGTRDLLVKLAIAYTKLAALSERSGLVYGTPCQEAG